MKNIINTDKPTIPKGYHWMIEEHQPMGKLDWNKIKIELYLSDGQKDGKYIEGNKLRKELKGKKVLNACVLDFLLANPHLIPEEWKGKVVFFWGTIYRHSGGYLDVRYLIWLDGRWYWNFHWLGFGWHSDRPAAVLASPLSLEPKTSGSFEEITLNGIKYRRVE